MMNMEQALEKTGKDITTPAAADLQPVDKWILSKLNTLVKDVTDNMDHFELGIAVQKVYDFIWDEFCDWYIEMVKPRLYSTDDAVSQNAALWTLKTVLIPGATLYIPFAELVDIAQEIERLKKEQKRLEGELARSKGMLSNERFLSKAPEAKIAEEKEKLAKYEQMMEQVTKRLEQLA